MFEYVRSEDTVGIKYPIDYKIIDDSINFFYDNGIRASVFVISIDLKLNLSNIYEEYGMTYFELNCYNMKEEDAERFVRYINSRALLKKI